MEQIETAEIRERSTLPVMEPRWDPEKTGKRKVRVRKVPHGYDPMKEKTVFEFGGFVYICYAKKTRGRSMIRCLGIADVENDRRVMDTGPAAKGLKDAIDDDVMKEATGKKQTPFEGGSLLDKATKELADDSMGDAIKEAIDDEIVQKVIAEVTGDGQSPRSN